MYNNCRTQSPYCKKNFKRLQSHINASHRSINLEMNQTQSEYKSFKNSNQKNERVSSDLNFKNSFDCNSFQVQENVH